MTTSSSTVLAALVVVGFVHTAAADPPPEPPPQPAASTAPIVPPPVEDFDLSQVGLDPAAGFDDKLTIFGFADFTYNALHFSSPPIGLGDARSFGVGNLNIYLSKNLTRRWRTLAEVRYLFSPNGNANPDGTITDTTTQDPANLYRPIEVGGIRIERVYLEYDLHPKLTIRAGHFLSPYGIWNIDHGSPTYIPAVRPYVIGEQFIPDHQTGIELFGATYFGEYRLAYHATVSNGRHPAEATYDPDMKLAFGGRLELTAPFAGTLKLGISGYRGRATALAANVLAVASSFEEAAYAADAVWQHGELVVQGEVMVRDHRYLVGQRPASFGGFLPNGRDVGAYALAGYRFDRAWHVMPFAMYEYYKPLERVLFGRINVASVGLNFRPTPTVVLKAMGTAGTSEGAGTFGELGHLYAFTSQVAWVF